MDDKGQSSTRLFNRQISHNQSRMCRWFGYIFHNKAINCYLIYDGVLSILVLKRVKNEVDLKKDLFYRRVENKKAQVLALMKEL